MGKYINKGNDGFASIRNSKFVDKSRLIAQVKQQEYAGALCAFAGEVLLVGINYNKKTKTHECRIEKWEKTQGVTEKNLRSNPKNLSNRREISRSKKIDKIVEFCSEPKSLEEIATYLSVKDRNFMKKLYIDSILGTRLRMTEPDSPTSPTQKYVRILDGNANVNVLKKI